MYARTIFYKINTVEPLNPEAAVLWVSERPLSCFYHKILSLMLCAITNEQEYYHIFLLYIYICILFACFF